MSNIHTACTLQYAPLGPTPQPTVAWYEETPRNIGARYHLSCIVAHETTRIAFTEARRYLFAPMSRYVPNGQHPATDGCHSCIFTSTQNGHGTKNISPGLTARELRCYMPALKWIVAAPKKSSY